MSALVLRSESFPSVSNLPAPRTESPISIRAAFLGAGDVKFIDGLQRIHSKMVGWTPLPQLESNIKSGNILIAEAEGKPIGYVLFKDKYFKREDCGICYQLNVVPGSHRKLVGAALIRAAFDRCPFGVKLFCCWCAQDIDANYFWESIGFVPLAFRAGSRGKAQGGTRKQGRVHIFWQRRVHEGDVTTPYWFPSETTGGALKENRVVLPIPVDKHWSDTLPMVLPGIDLNAELNALEAAEAATAGPKEKKARVKKVPVPIAPANSFGKGGLRFGPPPTAVAEFKPKKEKRPKQKNDPRHLIVARGVRDCYLDEINTGRMLPSGTEPKYEVGRQFGVDFTRPVTLPLLAA